MCYEVLAPLIKLTPLIVIDKTKGINNLMQRWICKCFVTFSRGATSCRKSHHCNIPRKNASSNFKQTFTHFEIQSHDLPVLSLLILHTDLLLLFSSPPCFIHSPHGLLFCQCLSKLAIEKWYTYPVCNENTQTL